MGRIKLGICQKSLGLPFRRSLPAARQLGVDGIELEATGELRPQNLTATARREITHLLRSSDLAVCAIACPTRRGLDDPADLEPRLDQIRQAMALAFDLGPRLVIIQPGRLGEPSRVPGEPSPVRDRVEPPEHPRTDHMKESLDALGRHGDRVGVTVALDTGLDAPETLAAYLDQFDCGSLAVNFNPAHLVISGHDPAAALTTLRRRIVHFHAQDARRISPNRMATVPLGHGDLDWMHLAACLGEMEYAGYVTIIADDRAESAAGVRFLRRFVA